MKKKAQYKIKELMDGLYVLAQGGVCMYLLVGDTHALVFDTGCGMVDPLPQIRTLTDKPLYVVNSHGHYDHTGGNSFFQEPVYIHEEDKLLHDRHNSPDYRKMALDGLKAMQRILFFLNLIPSDLDENAYIHAPLFSNFRFVKENDCFDLGGCSARVIEIPGHTQGSIGILVKEKRIFLASDGICGNVWLFLPESSKLSIYRESLNKANELDFDWLLTGHSDKLFPKAVLKDYIAVAKKPDFAGGRIQNEIGFAPGVIPRACREEGSRQKPRKQRNKAQIVISEEKL